MNDLISIIVPIYNSDMYLQRCIDSLILQSIENIEIILVDDGSTDGSGVLCDEYKNKYSRVKVIHKKNSGVSSTRNAGINIAKGKYIMFCDSDDIVSVDWCKHLYEMASTFDSFVPMCSICYKKEVVGISVDIPNVKHNKKYLLFDYQPLIKIGAGFLVNKIFLRSVIIENGIFFRSLPEKKDYNEDLIFVLEYIKLFKGYIYNGYSDYCYIVRNNSLSTCNRQDLIDKYIEKYKIWKEYIINYCYGNTEYLNDIANNTLYQIVSFLSIEASGKCISPTVKFIECVKSETLHDVILSINKPQENIRIIEAIKEKNYNKLWRILKISNIKRRIKK